MGLLGSIYKTTNGGTTWTTLSSPTMLDFNSVYFPDADTGYVVGGSGNSGIGIILKTINGGTTWNVLLNLPSVGLASVYATDANTVYTVGDLGNILKTINGGLNWTLQESGTTKTLESVYFTNADTGYVVGDGGTILKTTDGGALPTGLTDLSSEFKTLSIYPNPCSTQITIETPVISAKSQLSIMDLNGQEFISRQITEPRTVINITSLPSGVYIVRVYNDKSVFIGKFVKQSKYLL